MTTTFDTIADIMTEICNIDRAKILPTSHATKDLGIDSLDFLDVTFAIEKKFGIKLPIEKWTQEVNDGKVPAEHYFIMQALCDRVDELVAAKTA